MLYNPTLISIIEVLLVTLPALLFVAYVTVAERKILASMQRRLGPNIIGYYGSLQAFADALKLLLKEYISPTQANIILFFLGPFITLVFSLLGYAVIPHGPGLAITDFNLGILYILAVSSLSTYGILLAGWSANSKYAFLGSLRSTAQLISYELILSSAILLVVLLTGSLNLTVNIEAQRAVWFIAPLLPIFIVFFIGSIAETNRAPFDLAEAESELVSGFMTEHAAVIFVFFFLAEYASIALICILVSTLFLGGYLLDITFISNNVISSYIIIIIEFGIGWCVDFLFFIITLIEIDFNAIYFIITLIDIGLNTMSFSDLINAAIPTINPLSNSLSTPFIFHQFTLADGFYITDLYYQNSTFDTRSVSTLFDYLTKGLYYGLVLSLKSFFMIFVFIWARACFPRIRFDQLMSFCWTILLPILIGFILLVPCFIYSFDSIASNFCLLASFFISSNNKKVCFASKTLTLKAKRFFFITKNLLGDDKPGMSAARLEEIVTQAQFDLYMSGLHQGKISAETIAKSAGLSLKDIEAEVAEEEKERKRVKNKKKNDGRKKKKAAVKEENFNEENVNEKNVSEEKGKGKEENNSEKKGKGKEENVKKLTKVNYSSLNLKKPLFALALALKGASIGFACILIATLLPVAIEFILLVPCLFTPLIV